MTTTPTEPTPADPLGLAAQVKHFAAANARLAAELEQARAENARVRQQGDEALAMLKRLDDGLIERGFGSFDLSRDPVDLTFVAILELAGRAADWQDMADKNRAERDEVSARVSELARQNARLIAAHDADDFARTHIDALRAEAAAPPVLARDTRVLLDGNDRRYVVASWHETPGGAVTVRLMPEQLPDPDVAELVDTPAGRRWLAGAPAREANRPTPAVNTREQILEQLTPAAIWSDEDLLKVVSAARGAGAVQDCLRDGLVERRIPADGDAVDAALAELDRLRAGVERALGMLDDPTAYYARAVGRARYTLRALLAVDTTPATTPDTDGDEKP